MGEKPAESIMTAPREQMALPPAYCDRGRDPVITDTGLVLDLEDVMGGKVCALASRIEPRRDHMTDARFADVGRSQADATALRERFADWPRDVGAIDRQLHIYAVSLAGTPGLKPRRDTQFLQPSGPAVTGQRRPVASNSDL